MELVGMKLNSGRLTTVTRYSDGLYLEVLGVDYRDPGVSLVGDPAVVAGSLATLFAFPTPIRLPTGASTYTFTAAGYDASGNAVSITPVWSIVQASPYASINASTGVLTTGISTQEETITVRATVGAITANATVIIEDVVIDDLTVFPDGWALTVGQTRLFTASGFASGVEVGIAPTWSKVSGVGSIHASTGLYTAGTTPGNAVIRATVGAVTTDAAIEVAAGAMVTLVVSPTDPSIASEGTEAFTVTGTDAYGNAVAFDGSPIVWSVESGGTISYYQDTATLTAATVGVTTNYPNPALSVTYRDLSVATGFTVEAPL